MTFNLNVDSAEAADLREALQAMIRQLLDELTHADQRDYRAMLRDKLARFEALAEKLDRARSEPVEVIHFA